MTVFTIDEVRKTFSNGEVKEEILKGVNLSLREGEITALVGASGSGKSTLLTIAAGLQPASGGKVLFEEKNMITMSPEQVRKIRACKFGFVFQFAHLVPFLTVEEQLMLMLDVSELKLKKDEQKAEIDKVLKLVGMDHRKKLTRLHCLAGKSSGLQLPVQSSINLKCSSQMNPLQVWIQKDLKMLCC